MHAKNLNIASKGQQSLSAHFGLASVFAICINILIPKGGILASGIPITWGYSILGLFAIVSFLVYFRDVVSGLLSARAFLIFSFPIFAAVWINGVGYADLGMTIALFVATAFMPFLFVINLRSWFGALDYIKLSRVTRVCVILISVWGILSFVVYNYFGKQLGVPYITTGGDDIYAFLEKNNMRGDISKMTSTYNNGNIFGISLLLLFSIADRPRHWAYWVISRSAVLLTLSRTVWIGWFFYELIKILLTKKLNLRMFFGLICVLILGVIGIYIGLEIFNSDYLFLFDTSMGGRLDLDWSTFSAWPQIPFTTVSELVYVSIFFNFGALGLVLFVLQLFMAPILLMFRSVKFPIAESRVWFAGILTYLFICVSDGAFLLIPVSCFYWFLVGLFLGRDSAVPIISSATTVDRFGVRNINIKKPLVA